MHRAIKCPCGDAICQNWLVSGVADVQGVSFTEHEARAVDAFLNSMDTEAEIVTESGLRFHEEFAGELSAEHVIPIQVEGIKRPYVLTRGLLTLLGKHDPKLANALTLRFMLMMNELGRLRRDEAERKRKGAAHAQV